MHRLLSELQTIHRKAQDLYKQELLMRVREVDKKMEEAEVKILAINRMLREAEQKAKAISEQNQFGSRWVIRLYLISISSSILSALMTLLVIWISKH